MILQNSQWSCSFTWHGLLLNCCLWHESTTVCCNLTYTYLELYTQTYLELTELILISCSETRSFTYQAQFFFKPAFWNRAQYSCLFTSLGKKNNWSDLYFSLYVVSTYRSIILHTVHRPVRPYFITILCLFYFQSERRSWRRKCGDSGINVLSSWNWH